MKKERVDVLLVEQGLFMSREQAKRAVMAGEVYDQNNERQDKPGVKIAGDTILHVKGKTMPYVSRGGLKLAKALDVFALDLTGLTVLDIGASTGGFTDVALQHGAKMSYALDVGYNQLAWKLREDPRVKVMERVNFRYSKPEDFSDGPVEFAMTDVSFISLKLILPPLHAIIQPGGHAVALIKPQFEAGPSHVGKKGIVRDPAVHRSVLTTIVNFALGAGYNVLGLDFSPIKGGEGNIEFLIHLQQTERASQAASTVDIEQTLAAAYAELRPGH